MAQATSHFAGMAKIGAELRGQSGSESTSLPALRALFEQAGLEVLDTTAIEVSLDFPSFDEYWRVQTPPLHPNVKTITALPETERARLIGLVRDELTARPDGSVTTSSRANAIKARVPA